MDFFVDKGFFAEGNLIGYNFHTKGIKPYYYYSTKITP